VETAIARIMQMIGFGSSNYGNSLADFEDGWMRLVSNKTTVIILGDARGNRTDPRTDIMQRLSQRSKRIIWLNPEFRSARGAGDRSAHKLARAHHRVAQSKPLGQGRRNAASERAACAVRVSRDDARRGELLDAVDRRQQVHHLLAGQMPTLQQHRRNAEG